MVNDPIGDMLTRLRNSQQANKAKVVIPVSKEKLSVLEVLKKEGYIRDFSIEKKNQKFSIISVLLKYYDGKPVISRINRVSKPGCRVYASVNKLGSVNNGLGVKIISTSKGVVSDTEAKSLGVGGEILCEVF